MIYKVNTDKLAHLKKSYDWFMESTILIYKLLNSSKLFVEIKSSVEDIISNIPKATNGGQLANIIIEILKNFTKKRLPNIQNFKNDDTTDLNKLIIKNCKDALNYVYDIIFVATKSKIIVDNIEMKQINCEDNLKDIFTFDVDTDK